jgi:hypothetical protein
MTDWSEELEEAGRRRHGRRRAADWAEKRGSIPLIGGFPARVARRGGRRSHGGAPRLHGEASGGDERRGSTAAKARVRAHAGRGRRGARGGRRKRERATVGRPYPRPESGGINLGR